MQIREEKLKAIINWSENSKDIRAVLLTSSLVNPLAPVDEFSDLDTEFVFGNNTKYILDNNWTRNFGNPIAMIEEDETYFDSKYAMKMVLYDDFQLEIYDTRKKFSICCKNCKTIQVVCRKQKGVCAFQTIIAKRNRYRSIGERSRTRTIKSRFSKQNEHCFERS